MPARYSGSHRIVFLEPEGRDFSQAERGDGAGDELDANGIERTRRKIFRREARPERVLVARDDREPGHSRGPDRVEDFRVVRVVAAIRESITLAWPFQLGMLGQVLQIRTPVERAEAVAPDLPRCRARGDLIDQPRALL